MIPESMFILGVLAAVFLAGASLGQLLLRLRLAKLERANMELENKKLSSLKRVLHSRAIIIEHRGTRQYDREVRDEIDEILGDIENT
jgi:Mg2+ and Co2+ transporter CorA